MEKSSRNIYNDSVFKRRIRVCEYFDKNGIKSITPFYYECKMKVEKLFMGQVVTDSLNLYDPAVDHYKAIFIEKVKLVKVGERSYIDRKSFIAL